MAQSFASEINERTVRHLPPIQVPITQDLTGEESPSSKNEAGGYNTAKAGIVKCTMYKKHAKKTSAVSKPSQAPIVVSKKPSPGRLH